VASFQGEDGGVDIYYSVRRLVRPCLSWNTSMPCATHGREFLYHVTRVGFYNPGDDGYPEPYGSVGLRPGNDHSMPALTIWSEESGNPPTRSEYHPSSPIGPLPVGSDARPCFLMSVLESDSTNDDDWLAHDDNVCGDDTYARSGRHDNWVEVNYDFYQVLPGA
jgi:hypothetical protein